MTVFSPCDDAVTDCASQPAERITFHSSRLHVDNDAHYTRVWLSRFNVPPTQYRSYGRCAGMTFLFLFPSHSHRIIPILIPTHSHPHSRHRLYRLPWNREICILYRKLKTKYKVTLTARSIVNQTHQSSVIIIITITAYHCSVWKPISHGFTTMCYDVLRSSTIYYGYTAVVPRIRYECRRRTTITYDYLRFNSRFTYECTTAYYEFSRWTYEQSWLRTIPYDSRRLGYTTRS